MELEQDKIDLIEKVIKSNHKYENNEDLYDDFFNETCKRSLLIIKTIASDIAEGPLQQAKNNIKREHLEKKIETRLGDGLDTYSKEINTIIISGMGGKTIIGILKKNPKVLKEIDTLILSPNNYQEDVKRYCCKSGFLIQNEEFVKDKNFIYQILILKRGKKHYSKKEYFFGPVFLIKKGPLFHEYYEREKKSREILLSLLPKNFYYKRLITKKEINWIQKEIED